MNIEKFVKERNDVLFSLDDAKIKAYCKKYDVQIPDNPEIFWEGIYKSILCIVDAPKGVRIKAQKWLDEHGFKHTMLS